VGAPHSAFPLLRSLSAPHFLAIRFPRSSRSGRVRCADLLACAAALSPSVSTVLAVAGKDYVIVAGDTRMSDGYSILSRDVSKLFQLTPKTVLASAGMQADAVTLRKVLAWKIIMYRHKHNKDMSTTAIAQLLGNTLYYKRFFPYYCFNVLAGLDNEGKGAVYGYDAIGSFERIPYGVTGSGSALITSILDNQVAFKTNPSNYRDLSFEECMDLVKDVMTSAGERDIYTGDSVDIVVINKDGMKEEKFQLKKD
jgi:20S proteasome subunit beta 6